VLFQAGQPYCSFFVHIDRMSALTRMNQSVQFHALDNSPPTPFSRVRLVAAAPILQGPRLP